MLFYTLQRLGSYKHEDSQGTVVLAAIVGCAVQVGRESLATASSGRPGNTPLAEAGEDRSNAGRFFLPYNSSKIPRDGANHSVKARRKEEEDGQAPSHHIPVTCPLSPVSCPQGITCCSEMIRAPQTFESALCPFQASFLSLPSTVWL